MSISLYKKYINYDFFAGVKASEAVFKGRQHDTSGGTTMQVSAGS